MKNNKVEQLENLLSLMGEAERKYCRKQEAGLTFWYDMGVVYIDADAVRALIEYYKSEEE